MAYNSAEAARFLSTPSARRATPSRCHLRKLFSISIHALREEGDAASCDVQPWNLVISIHALREEGDPKFKYPKQPDLEISIHALREEGDPEGLKEYTEFEISIHALREEGDPSARPQACRPTYFYPRPPRGGRLGKEHKNVIQSIISIHALREEGDFNWC